MGFPQYCIISLSMILRMYMLSFAAVCVNGANNCSYSDCATHMYSSSYYYYNYYTIPDRDGILFPFRTPDQEESCGLPGFELSCNDTIGKPVLAFPSGQSYTVESMFNYSREVEVSDPRGCLRERLLEFNSSGTPFRPRDGFTEFTLYSCPSAAGLPDVSYACVGIGCDRGAPYTHVICDTYKTPSGYGRCNLVGNVNVAGDWASAYSFRRASSLYLTWDTPPECVECASRGEDCRRHPSNSSAIGCVPRPHTPSYQENTNNRGVITIVLLVFLLPIVFVGVCACYIRYIQIQSRRSYPTSLPNIAPISQTQHVTPTSSTNTRSNITSGVEQATLDTYPIIVVGDSGRMLMKMEDKTCPICLSDYEPRDVLKILPECLHKFHSECIDEWLHAKAMCPVCRTMPLRAT